MIVLAKGTRKVEYQYTYSENLATQLIENGYKIIARIDGWNLSIRFTDK